jgi:hypothetical protein
MNNFLKTGIYNNGCVIPVTVEDPSLLLILDEFTENFRINIYCGQSYIDSITMSNFREICNDVSSLVVQSRHGEYLGNVWSLINEQMYYDYLKIHS